MKNFTLNAFLVFAALLSFSACTKSGNAKKTTTTAAATFIVDGTTYSGTCTSDPSLSGCSTSVDVALNDKATGKGIAIFNIPQTASGNYTFVDGYVDLYNPQSASPCDLYAASAPFSPNGSTIGSMRGGSLTKTGTNSFTFSCVLYDPGFAGYTVTGSGTY